MVIFTKFGDNVALFWTFKLLRKIETQPRKIGPVVNLALQKRDCPSLIGMVGNYGIALFFLLKTV